MIRVDETPLEMAIRHIVEGEERYARQVALVACREQEGRDITEAERLLINFEQVLSLMREHRNRLLEEQKGSEPAVDVRCSARTE
jgi:hypothetical protein